MWFEPTSVPKAKKASIRFLNKVFAVTPNEDELIAMVQAVSPSSELKWWENAPSSDKKPEDWIRALMTRTAVKNVLLKRGSEEVVLGQRNPKKPSELIFTHIPVAATKKVINVTGAGDNFAGATIWGILQKYSLPESIQFGIAAARMCIESEFAVNPILSQQTLFQKVGNAVSRSW